MKNLFTMIIILNFCFLENLLATNVGKWDRFEKVITNNNKYADPFRDVDLNVTYTNPSGKEINFFGFYDGDTTWRFRFMPDEIGTWKYTAKFSDNSKQISGTFHCVESDIPGMIYCDETNPNWFGFKGGNHILIRSLHCGSNLFKDTLSYDRRETFLNWAKSQGYNTLSVGMYFSGHRDDATQRLWQFNNPSPPEYRKSENILNQIIKHGFIIYPFYGFIPKGGHYPKDLKGQEVYIKYTIARFAPYWNLIFNITGPEVNHYLYISMDNLDTLGKMVKKYDIFDHLRSAHYWPGNDPNRKDNWVSYVCLQGPQSTDYAKVYPFILNNRVKGKPTFAQETVWYGNKFQPKYTEVEGRKITWILMMAQAAYNIADNDGNNSTGFSGSLDPKDAIISRHDVAKNIWDFMESIPYYKMNPDTNITDNGYCLAKHNEMYLVYLPNGGKINLNIKKANYSVTWINARNTKEKIDGGFTKDGKNLTAQDNEDWLLYLVREKQ